MDSDGDSDDLPLRQTQGKRKAEQQDQARQQNQDCHRPRRRASNRPRMNYSRAPLMGEHGPVNEASVVIPIPNYGYLVQSPQSIISVPYHLMPENRTVARSSQHEISNQDPCPSLPITNRQPARSQLMPYRSVVQQPGYHPSHPHTYQTPMSHVELLPQGQGQGQHHHVPGSQHRVTNNQGPAFGVYSQRPPPQQMRHQTDPQLPDFYPDGMPDGIPDRITK